MTSKEALEEIKQAPTFMGGNPRYMCSTQSSEPFLEDIKIIEKDLELLENVKSKTLLRYSARRKIAEKYLKWCKDNNVMISDATNMITWLLCFKLKEWLENDK